MNPMNPNLQQAQFNNHIPTQGSLEDLSKDEQNKLMRAMKKPEFMGLMNDYMLEISDPKNKDEYDEYLKQLERDGDMPKGLKLIRPDPEFCIKTTMATKKDKGQNQKLFINICSSKILEEPGFKVVEQDGKSGQSWSLPYSAGKIRYDQTKKDEVCNTIDVAFHPRAFDYAQFYPQFQQLICETGIDATRKQMGERTEDISSDYTVLQNMKCKGGTPALLTIRVSHGKKGLNKQEQSETERRQGGEGRAPKLYRDIQNQKEEYQSQKEKEEKENKKKKQKENNEDQEEDVEQEEQEEFEYNANGERVVKVPKNKIVYSYPVQYEDFIEASKSDKKFPIEIGLNVSLPGCESVKEVELDIDEQKVVLTVKNKYFLEKKLPYPILADQGSAKFESKKKMLRIRLKVDKQAVLALEDQNKIEEKPKIEEIPQENNQEEQEVEVEAEQNKEEEQQEVEEKEQQNKKLEFEEQPSENQEQEAQVQEIEEKFEKKLQEFQEQQNETQENQAEEKQQEQEKQQQQDSDDEQEDEESLLKQKKPQIEEIVQETVEVVDQEKLAEIQKNKVKSTLSAQTQENSEKFFFIINVPKYKQENVKHLIFDKQILIQHEDSDRINYIRIEIEKEIDEEKSDVSFVTDYVVVNLVKKDKEDFWEKSGFKFHSDENFDDFKASFQDLLEAFKIVQINRETELQNEKQLQKTEALDELEDEDNENEKDGEKQEGEEEEQLNPEEQRRKDIIENLKLKIEKQVNTVQFLDFREVAQSAFDIE